MATRKLSDRGFLAWMAFFSTLAFSPYASAAAPIITEQPQAKFEKRNTWVELRVSAKGPPFPKVQWYRNSVPVPGATSGSYWFPVSESTAGFYAAIVYFDSQSMTTSQGVYVAMVPDGTAPTITSHPVSQRLGAGGVAKLTAGFTGNPFPKVQWYKDGIFIPGQNAATLNVSAPGKYSYYIWNKYGGANSYSAVVLPAAPDLGGIAFSFASPENGTEVLRVGHAKFEPDGTITGKFFKVSQNSVRSVSSGIQGYTTGGARCGAVLKPVLQEYSLRGTYSMDVNKIQLVFDGQLASFARTNGSKKVQLLAVGGVSRGTGFGYHTSTDPSLPGGVNSDLDGKSFRIEVGRFYHRRSTEAWWILGYEMGLAPHAYRDEVSSGIYYGGNQYDSLLFRQVPSSPNVVMRHFGTDSYNYRCNNSDGHLHFLYGIGENNRLIGFMGVESSPSLNGGYVSVFSALNPGLTQ